MLCFFQFSCLAAAAAPGCQTFFFYEIIFLAHSGSEYIRTRD